MFNEARIAAVALDRDGVFHRRDARAAGFTDRQIVDRLRAGVWSEVLPRVYRHAATPLSPELVRCAALLWAGAGAALSHRSAAAIWQLDGVTEEVPELTVPGSRNPRSPLVLVHRTGELRRADVATVDGLRFTSVARTIVDLAAVVEEEALETAVESARRRHGTRIAALTNALDRARGPGHAGTPALRRVLEAVEGRPAAESVFEVKVARLLRASGLPEPVRQHYVVASGRRYRLDFAWPWCRVALECDGRAFHSFQRDRTKWRHLGASGWKVLPVTWADVMQSWPAVVRDLAAALTR
jgi:very-short-patch-repair endonuclease